jgi:hypothetical protein
MYDRGMTKPTNRSEMTESQDKSRENIIDIMIPADSVKSIDEPKNYERIITL